MGEWVPSEVTETRLQRWVEKGLLLLKEVTGWRATARDVLPFPQLDEVVSFTNFHERGFTVLALDFFRGFLREYGV